jgi:hypothetical protein
VLLAAAPLALVAAPIRAGAVARSGIGLSPLAYDQVVDDIAYDDDATGEHDRERHDARFQGTRSAGIRKIFASISHSSAIGMPVRAADRRSWGRLEGRFSRKAHFFRQVHGPPERNVDDPRFPLRTGVLAEVTDDSWRSGVMRLPACGTAVWPTPSVALRRRDQPAITRNCLMFGDSVDAADRRLLE